MGELVLIPPSPSSLHDPLTPEKLRGLSVREISERFGSRGLDYAIDAELARLDLADNPMIAAARQMGYTLHQHDARSDGSTAADHLRRCGLRMMRELGVTDPHIIAGDFLHDVVEDHAPEVVALFSGAECQPEEARERAVGYISHYFSPRTAEFVDALTFPKMPKGPRRLIAYHDKTCKVLQDPTAQLGKLPDFIDNGAENGHTRRVELRLRLDTKYLACFRPHAEALRSPDCLVSKALRPSLEAQLQTGHDLATARLQEARRNELVDDETWQMLHELKAFAAI